MARFFFFWCREEGGGKEVRTYNNAHYDKAAKWKPATSVAILQSGNYVGHKLVTISTNPINPPEPPPPVPISNIRSIVHGLTVLNKNAKNGDHTFLTILP